MIFSIKNRMAATAFLAALAFASCKKSDVSGGSNTPPTEPPAQSSKADKMKDTALAYSKDIYLWNTQIPSTFNARSYADLNKLMTAIRTYSIETGFSKPVDRWSFAVTQAEWDDVSAGIAGDFGLNVFFPQDGDLRVRMVEKASPAGKAGIKRGWRITAINGNNNMSYANADFIVDKIYNSNSVTVAFQKPDNTTVTINLAAATYKSNPVIIDTVYDKGANKVGYFALNSFLGDTTQVYNEFTRIFNNFSAKGVNDVIIDLRYNGGGYVTMSQRMADWLAPASANGQVMMKQEFNTNYSDWNSTTRFNKLGNLNLNRIFFLVSNNTASASELLINNLKPFMEVNLVGPSATYGKPVGYFNIPVGDWYIFPVSFRSTNKNGEGGYFDGLQLSKAVADGLDKDWGDENEAVLHSALSKITTGQYRTATVNGRKAGFETLSPAGVEANKILDEHSFKGTIDPRRVKL